MAAWGVDKVPELEFLQLRGRQVVVPVLDAGVGHPALMVNRGDFTLDMFVLPHQTLTRRAIDINTNNKYRPCENRLSC